MKKYLLAIICIAICTTGCYKDEDNTPPPEVIVEISEVLINTTVIGTVLDLTGEPMRSYSLMINEKNNAVETGLFHLELNEVRKKGQTFHVLKDGKRIGISTQLLVENDINHFEIQGHDFYSQKFISDSDHILNVNESIELDFSSAVWSNGYLGDPIVDFTHMDEDVSLTPVGYSEFSDLLAIDSKGGFYVQAKGNNDEKLTATNDNPIILKINGLPEHTNSLFWFDEEEEIWMLVSEISEGDEVEIEGGGYFTFANYTKGVFVEGRVSKEDKPVAYQPMQWDLLSMSNDICATEMGRWIGLLPENEDVSVNLLNPCAESLQEETLIVQVDDIKDQNLVIGDNANYQLLDMQIFDCAGNTVTTPNLNIESNNNSYHYIFSEDYNNRWIAVCNEYSLAAANTMTGESGPRLDWSTEIEGNYGIMTECEDLAEGYSYIKIEDEMKIYEAFVLEEAGESTVLQSKEGEVTFIFKGTTPGMYKEDEVNVSMDDPDFGFYIKCENSPVGCGISEFNVTHFETNENGSVIRVVFSGTLWMQTISPPVAGNFDVEGIIIIKR